jgi:hypothetical protein
VGMDSKRLSERTKQPGHDQTYVVSETSFVTMAREVLGAPQFLVREKPRDLCKMFGGRYGVIPEACVDHVPSGRKMYFEVKKQEEGGNADERACKHHTVQFSRAIRAFTGLDYHPFCTILCNKLATMDRYTKKHPFFFEPNHYFHWVEYRPDLLEEYLNRIASLYLNPRR